MTDRHQEIATQWVQNWVDFNVKARVLDGRPDRVFIKTLTQDLAALLRSLDEPTPKPKKGRSNEH